MPWLGPLSFFRKWTHSYDSTQNVFWRVVAVGNTCRHFTLGQLTQKRLEIIMEYVTQELDRTTGDIKEISLGQYYTISELAKQYGENPNTFRAILHHMGMLQVEGRRHRLPLKWVKRGYGKRHENPKSGRPFDVISPLGQRIIAEAWGMTKADYEQEYLEKKGFPQALEGLAKFGESRLPVGVPYHKKQEEISFLEDFYGLNPVDPYIKSMGELSHNDIGEILEVTQQYVNKISQSRRYKRQEMMELKSCNPESRKPLFSYVMGEDGETLIPELASLRIKADAGKAWDDLVSELATQGGHEETIMKHL